MLTVSGCRPSHQSGPRRRSNLRGSWVPDSHILLDPSWYVCKRICVYIYIYICRVIYATYICISVYLYTCIHLRVLSPLTGSCTNPPPGDPSRETQRPGVLARADGAGRGARRAWGPLNHSIVSNNNMG